MRSNPIPLIAGLLLLAVNSYTQDINRNKLFLKSGTITLLPNLSTERLTTLNRNTGTEKKFVIIQFSELPTFAIREQLSNAGIELLDYVPSKAYTAVISRELTLNDVTSAKMSAILELDATQKMQPLLAKGNFPAHAVKVAGTIDINAIIVRSTEIAEATSALSALNFSLLPSDLASYHILTIRVPVSRLGQLALLPFIEFLEAVPGPEKPLSPFWTNWGRDGVRASMLTASLANGGRGLDGQGVVIGFGDDADPQLHVDFTGRLITRAVAGYGLHGTHVAGIIGGAGIRNEVRVGFAPKATLISQTGSGIVLNAPVYVNDFGMVLTNNSYGDEVEDCTTFGNYDIQSRIVDLQAYTLPELQHVFAAGNTGMITCLPYPDSFHTVIGGYQSAKNALVVGNATPIGYLYQASAKGPVSDGRIKPEIIGIGSFIESTAPPPFDFYLENTGTSMAAPGITGGLALLYQQYRQLHPPNLNPKNGLMKALVCNSGDDWGTPGPDYAHGFGVANFWRASEMLANNHYQVGTIAPGPADEITVNVPAGTGQLKVMLYWNDPAAAAVSSQTLVNDLDLEVVTPSSVVVLPFVLDTLASNVKNPATTGVDHINNIEQVVIQNPTSGNYIIRVNPTLIAQNPSQEYFIVYDFVPLETRLMTPAGGETYVQGENVIVRWDSYGAPSNSFTLEFSDNNGGSWTTLRNNIDPSKREYFYTVPDPNEWFIVPQVTTDQARMRITRNGTGINHTSEPFVISDTIFVTLSADQCESYFSIDWTAVTGATGYEVMMMQGGEMLPVAIVSNSTFTYTFSGLSKDSVYWATVRPLIGISNSPGRRGIAVFRKPDSGTCTNPASNNDIKLDAIVSPARSGRLLTSSTLGNSVPVTITIKNLDNAATTGNITMTYVLNNGTPVVHVLTNPNIPGLSAQDFSFTGDEVDLSAAGTYTLDVSISYSGDPVTSNNTLTKIVRQLSNPVINLAAPHVDNFDAAPAITITTPVLGLPALDAYDFTTSTAFGQLRTFINTGIAYSGDRAITLDSYIYNPAGTVDSLTGTYNLSNYSAINDDVRLTFRYKNHGQEPSAANKVWIRGTDADDWIEAYDLDDNQADADGTYVLTGSIEVSDLLRNAGTPQNFTSSFQVRWGQEGVIMAADNTGGAGYTFDDVTLQLVTDDMQLVAIVSPIENSCGLLAANAIKIAVKNSNNSPVTSVPVRYRINGGAWSATELIPAIPANDTVQYEFTATANLSLPGSYLIEAQVLDPDDTYHNNDTASLIIENTTVVNVTAGSPYLENFESGNGNWYTGGINSSWAYGTPASYKINKAASGIKAWKTTLSGGYNNREESYLYSPCFNVSTLSDPTLSFSVALDLEDCQFGLCDGAYIEYSLDGITWAQLGGMGDGTNWYNKDYGFGAEVWSVKNYQRWHVATVPLSVTGIPINQMSRIRFRFVLLSDPAVNREGIAIDDIHVYNNPYGIYTGATMGSPVTQNIPAASGWVDFIQDNQLVASVLSPVQAMGSTDVQAYINTGSVRVDGDQYYHDRNITIKPTTVNLTDSASVRFYFTDEETEDLINASGCAYCYKPASAYDLGVTKYSDPVDAVENGTLADNTPGNYLFIPPANAVRVPFDNGYYVEFKVKNFSEFWLNNGGFDNNHALPVDLISFTAHKTINQKDVLVSWSIGSASGVNRYEIEVARGNDDYQRNRFTKIGEVANPGDFNQRREFSFTDLEFSKTGTRYYRLKIIDNDGSVEYSPIRPVLFNSDVIWSVAPNPSNAIFNLTYQATEGEIVQLRVYDANGRLVKQRREMASGFIQKAQVDLGERIYANGLYMLEVSIGQNTKTFKLLKH